MLDAGLLLETLEGTEPNGTQLNGTELRELPVNDPRLQDLSASMTRGDYRAVGEQVEALLRDGIYDLRPLGGYLMALYLEQGIRGLAAGLAGATVVVGPHFESFGPRKRRASALDTALTWFGQNLLKLLRRAETEKNATWKAWRDPRNVEPMMESFEHLQALMKALEARVPNAHALEPLQELGRQIASYVELVAEGLESKQAPDPAAEYDDGDAAAEADAPTNLPATVPKEERREASKSPMSAGRGAGTETLTLQVSPALGQLLRQIAAFERLVARRRFERAAIIAADVQETLDHFDPLIMLPEVVAPFVRAMATHIEEIEPMLEQREGLAWRSLLQLYRVDLEGFVEG